MCSELATIVAMENNSFYIWGSRPAVVSPLSGILHHHKEDVKENLAEKHPGLNRIYAPKPFNIV